MKLIREFIIKEIILLFVALLIIESFIIYILHKRAKIIYDDTYNETMDKIENKTIEVAQKFDEFTKNYISKYLADLKLISMHSILFNINGTDDAILDNEYGITISDESLQESFPKFDMEKDNPYVDAYEKEFKDIYDRNIILNILFNNTEHPELNTIAYHNSQGDDLSNIADEEVIRIKNMIPIFKSLFIKRYLVKRNNTDYLRFFIFNKEKIYIYPPFYYESTPAYFYDKIYPTMDVCDTDYFPDCYYNYILNTNYLPLANLLQKNLNQINYLLIFREKMNLTKNYGSLCIRMKYLKNQEEPSFVCIEVDFSKLFNISSLDALEKYDIGILTNFGNNFFFSSSTSRYQKLYNVSNAKLFTFYHILYYNLSLSVQEKGMEIDWNEIDKEYEGIMGKIINKLNEFKTNKDKYIIINFNKTICRKKLLERGYEIIKDEFKLILVPVSFEIKLLDENYLEYGDPLLKNIDMYVYSIISTNPNTNKENLLAIVTLKRVRYILFCSLISFVILCLYVLFISLISQYSFNPIYDIQKQLNKLEITMKNNFILEEDKTIAPNKEIAELKEIYELMRKIQIIKNAFEKENYLKKHNVEFYNLTNDIKKKDIKEICTSFLGFYHFKNESYSLAENEFHSTILCLQERENEILSGKNTEFDDKIKDAIKR